MTPDIAGSINRTPTGSHRRCAMFNIFEISCKTESGLDGWYEWLIKEVEGRH